MGQLLEIACDESGYEGEKLIGTSTDVFAHGSVLLDTATAEEIMRELRDRIRSPATEYKANHILRQKHRAVLKWFLGPSGPVLGKAHVYLIDKPFYVVSKVVGLFAAGDPTATEMATALHAKGPSAFGPRRWEAFLAGANNLMRTNGRYAGPHADPTLDPLIPAITRTVAYWSKAGTPVAIAHHQQTTLSEARIDQLKAMSRSRLARLTFADGRWDLRIQIADIVAGAARKIASDELNGHGNPDLIALLRPYIDDESIWAGARFWSHA